MNKLTIFLFLSIQFLLIDPKISEARITNRFLLTKIVSSQDTVLKTGWYNVADFPEDNYPLVHIDKSTDEHGNYYVIPTPIITSKNIQRVELTNSQTPKLILHFDSDGTEQWSKATEREIGGTLVFMCDNKLIQVFRVKEKVTSGIVEIDRSVYSINDLKKFKLLIEKGKK